MALRLKINHVAEFKGEVLAHTVDGEEYFFDGTGDQYFAARVREFGSIDPDKWFFSRSIYGSKSYQDNCEEEKLAFAERYEGFGEGDDLAHVY